MLRVASPSPATSRVVIEATPSLTVAGPRRLCTGFPVRPYMGTQKNAAYHAAACATGPRGCHFRGGAEHLSFTENTKDVRRQLRYAI